MRANLVFFGLFGAVLSLIVVGAGSALAAPVHAGASPTWTELFPSKMPTNRDQVQMAYDPALKEVVLFGGYAPAIKALGDTWIYKGGHWKDLTSTLIAAPPARWGGSFAYDPQLGGIVLFGGRDIAKEFHDTWYFNGNGWNLITTTTQPAPRSEAAMAWDPIDHYLFLYGGANGNNPLGSHSTGTTFNDTWELSGRTWHQLANSPMGARVLTQMVYDPVDGYVLLMGGYLTNSTVSGAPQNDSWSYANGTWTHLSTRGGPTLLAATGILVWDTSDHAAVLFGGYLHSIGVYGNATWTYASGTWTNLTSAIPKSPPVRVACGMAYDSDTGQVLMFGGSTPAPNYSYYNDLWAFV